MQKNSNIRKQQYRKQQYIQPAIQQYKKLTIQENSNTKNQQYRKTAIQESNTGTQQYKKAVILLQGISAKFYIANDAWIRLTHMDKSLHYNQNRFPQD